VHELIEETLDLRGNVSLSNSLFERCHDQLQTTKKPYEDCSVPTISGGLLTLITVIEIVVLIVMMPSVAVMVTG